MEKSKILPIRFNIKTNFAWEFQFHMIGKGKQLQGHIDGMTKNPKDETALAQWETMIMSLILSSLDPQKESLQDAFAVRSHNFQVCLQSRISLISKLSGFSTIETKLWLGRIACNLQKKKKKEINKSLHYSQNFKRFNKTVGVTELDGLSS